MRARSKPTAQVGDASQPARVRDGSIARPLNPSAGTVLSASLRAGSALDGVWLCSCGEVEGSGGRAACKNSPFLQPHPTRSLDFVREDLTS